MPTVEDVRGFWENNALFVGESKCQTGTLEFFEEQLSIVTDDAFAGVLDPRLFPSSENRRAVLDLGCGPGLWTVELVRRGCTDVTAADLTARALTLARRRCALYGVTAQFSQQNAEELTFESAAFDHVNCQGVIHHTPRTVRCVEEIARVLKPGGTAMVAVYYVNIFLRFWTFLRPLRRFLSRLGGKLRGRGREGILEVDDVAELVRIYDGIENPVGKAYTRDEFLQMLRPSFEIEEVFLHFFPARSLPLPIPGWLHRFLDRTAGFMIFARLRKPG